MKKIILITLGLLLLSKSIAKASNDNEPIEHYIETVYIKEGGRFVWYQLGVRYDKIKTEKQYVDGGYRFIVTCLDPGHERCQKGPSKYLTSPRTPGDQLNTRIGQAEALFLESIEQDIINGEYSGSKSTTVCFEYNGHSYYFLYSARWALGDEYGNGKIIIRVTDITDEIGLR